MQHVAFHTLGCKLNFAETSTLARRFEQAGYKAVEFQAAADVYVINTCSVTENADRKCRNAVRSALRRNPEAFVAVVGCYAQLKPKDIAEIPGVGVVLGAAEKFQLVEHIEGLRAGCEPRVVAGSVRQATEFVPGFSLGDRTRSFLKVQDGCNYHCAFCTIPLARGRSRSPQIQSLVEQAEGLGRQGVREVVLTGVNIGDFGIVDGKRETTFLELLEALVEAPGIERYRISSIEPNLLSEEIIDFVAASGKIVPHFHLPLQSGSDTILKAMRRRYDTALYRRRVAQILDRMPQAAIGADVIVGFPSETEELFAETEAFLRDLPVAYLHVFTYSERPNTPAIEFAEPVPAAERQRRSQALRDLSIRKQAGFAAERVGATRTVLVEQERKGSHMEGWTEDYLRVRLPAHAALAGKLVEVEVGTLSPEGWLEGALLLPA